MIFATVGSTYFDSLIDNVNQLKLNNPNLNITCQIGSGKLIPELCNWFRYKETLVSDIDNADVVITHGGATVLQCLAANKKVIAVSNTDLADDHQTKFLSDIAQYIDFPWSNNPADLLTLYNNLGNYSFARSPELNNDLYSELFTNFDKQM